MKINEAKNFKDFILKLLSLIRQRGQVASDIKSIPFLYVKWVIWLIKMICNILAERIEANKIVASNKCRVDEKDFKWKNQIPRHN